MSGRMPRVAVIGAGVSGITASCVLQAQQFEVVIFERTAHVGGVWTVGYPEVRLQNLREHYHLSTLPWTSGPDWHPTAAQITRYWQEVITRRALDVRLAHRVSGVERVGSGWRLRYENADGSHEEDFDYVMLASGQYMEGKHRPSFPGQEAFAGEVCTERDVRDLGIFDGRRVAVVGFGKSALDMAALAAERSQQVWHVFRTPRWIFPERLLGIHASHMIFSRMGSVMMSSWGHPTSVERFLHTRLRRVVQRFWRMIAAIFRFEIRRHGWRKGRSAKDRLAQIVPDHDLWRDFRSAAAITPPNYLRHVAEGRIQPVHGDVEGFTADGLVLKDGQEIRADLVVLSVGSSSPQFPYLPAELRDLLECEPDGVQLYRHLIHPRIPGMGFAGFNHGFMHTASVEIGTLWFCAYVRGELDVPSIEEMERSVERVRAWKREHIDFEPARSCATNMRFQQYLDILLKDLGLSPYRKLPNLFAEVFGRYTAHDYRDVETEYRRRRRRRPSPVMEVDT